MYQNHRLKEFIEEARFQLRRVAGELTAEDIVAADRKKQAEDLEASLTLRLGIAVAHLTLGLQVVFEGDAAVAEFRCEGKRFRLRPAVDIWRLSLVDEEGETYIASVQSDDPLFRQRILVAIADRISQ